jgi:cell division transport system permease protein
MRAQFVLSEVGIGLRRNLSMTVAVIITVAMSLLVAGTGLLLRAQVNAMKDYWYDKVEVSVFLCGKDSQVPSCSGGAVSDAQRSQIQADLEALPQVQTVYYESQQQAYQRFEQQFKGTAIAQNVTPDQLPESFRVKLKDPTQFDVVAGAFQGRPGVEEVQDQRQLLDKFFRILNGARWLALGVALFMLIVATILVINTIRVAAFSRRRETGIMRLVGASNFYIQLPFLLESVIAALAGVFIAALGLGAFKAFLIDKVIAPAFPITRFFGWGDVVSSIALLFVLAVGIAATASFLTLQRYLRV